MGENVLVGAGGTAHASVGGGMGHVRVGGGMEHAGTGGGAGHVGAERARDMQARRGRKACKHGCHRPPLTTCFVNICPLTWGMTEGHVTV